MGAQTRKKMGITENHKFNGKLVISTRNHYLLWKTAIPLKTGFLVPRRARRKRRQEFKWFGGGISRVPNRKNQEFTKNTEIQF